MSRRVQAVLVIGWFVAVLLLDESTHPSIVAGILYLFPVALTGWTWGWRWAAVMAVVAFFCQLHSDLSYQSQVTDWQPVAANEFLIGVMVVATTVVSARLAHQQRVITAMRDVMARELDQARALQEVLYRGVPRHPSLDLATWFQPAGSLGGDAIKATLEGDLLMVALADVSGKGAPAALAASVLIGLLADAPGRTSDPAQVLAYLNERLAGHLEGEKFVTLFYMVLNLSDGSLTYASAGHEPVLLLDDGAFEELGATGVMLGVLSEAKYTQERRQLHSGDRVFGYTDGLVDAIRADGSRLGRMSVDELLVGAGEGSSIDLLGRLREHVGTAATTFPDDITLMVLRWRSV